MTWAWQTNWLRILYHKRKISYQSMNVSEGSVRGTPVEYTYVHLEVNLFRAAFCVSKRVSFCTVTRHPDVVSIHCKRSGSWVLIITCYCAPFKGIDLILEPLDTLLKTFLKDNVVLVGDFNAKSTIWRQRTTDPRRRSLIAFAWNVKL